jgi:hypothetical protein
MYSNKGLGFNNKYSDFAPLMSDSRMFTAYDPHYENNDKYMEKNNIETNYDYRQYLIQNADKIIKENQQTMCDQVGVCRFSSEPYVQRNPEGKYLYKGHSDKNQPYGYESSDMKDTYVQKSARQSRMAAPIMSQQNFKVK